MRYEDDFGSFWMVDDTEFIKRRHLSRGRPRKYELGSTGMDVPQSYAHDVVDLPMTTTMTTTTTLPKDQVRKTLQSTSRPPGKPKKAASLSHRQQQQQRPGDSYLGQSMSAADSMNQDLFVVLPRATAQINFYHNETNYNFQPEFIRPSSMQNLSQEYCEN